MMVYFVLLSSLIIVAIVLWLSQRKVHNLLERNKRLSVLRKLDEVMIASSTDLNDVAQKVTDAIAFELGFKNGVLALIDEQKGVLKRVAMSNTPEGIKAKSSLPIPYDKLEIPLTADENISIQAIKTGQRVVTHNLFDLFVPIFDENLSKKIQATVGVTTSLVYPIKARGKVIGVMIISLAQSESDLFSYEKESIDELFDVIGVTLDNATLYSRLRQTTEDLKVANTKLQQLDKLKDDFVSVASHELRTPMTAIRSYTWMALNRADVPLTEKMKKYLSRTLVSTERLINLVIDMLNVSRIEAGHIEINPKAFNLIGLVNEVIEEVQARATEVGVKVLEVENKLPEVFGDPDKVHEVLLNLIGNSLKFTPRNGSVTVSFFTDGQVIETSVRDTGVGISKDDASKLFQKFGRLDNSYAAISTSGGTGLGLYISKSLVALMHGKIWASSEGLNKGTTVTFSLPIATADIVAQSEKFHIKPADGEVKTLEPVAI